jgi:hypothetical protein
MNTNFLIALCTSAYPMPDRDEDEEHELSPLCDYCGYPSDYLVEVEDNDPSVGYRSSMSICPKCQTKIRIRKNRGY